MANLADVKREQIFVELKDGNKYELMYSLESFALMEEKYGSVEDAMKEFEKGKIAHIKYMLYLGFIHLDNPLEEAYIAKNINAKDMKTVMSIIMEALKADGELDNNNDPNK